MEEILGQVMKPPIKLKNFLKDYKQMFKTPYILPNNNLDLKKVLLLSDERFKEIDDKCSLENLEEEDDPRVAEFIPGFSEVMRVPNTNLSLSDIKLKSYETSLRAKGPRKGNPFKRSTDIYINYREAQKESLPNATVLQPYQELKIMIRLYRPARVTHAGKTIERPVFSQEFECLGSNLLTELRDKIFCVCNDKVFCDVSESPEAPLPDKETDPGYFFITDTFYNDQRNPLNPDYSETIRNWAKKAKGLSHLEFKIARMEEVRLIDLTVSLGFPQLYQHHGNCEHVFVFSQLEIVTNPQKQLIALSNYPHIRCVNRFTARNCHICSKVNYVFVVEGSNRLLNDPSYLCRPCFMSYHYVDGKKVGDFRAYRVNLNEETPTATENLELNEDVDTDDYEINNDFSYFNEGCTSITFVKKEKNKSNK